MVKVPRIITSSLAWTRKVEYRKVQYWIEKPICRIQSYTIHRVAFAMLCLGILKVPYLTLAGINTRSVRVERRRMLGTR